jgi:hypothetical protein
VSRVAPLFSWQRALTSDASDASPLERHVGLQVSLYMSAAGEGAWPGVDRIAREMRRGKSTVRDGLRGLDEKGWLKRTIRRGRGLTNTYEARIPRSYYERLDPKEKRQLLAVFGLDRVADEAPLPQDATGALAASEGGRTGTGDTPEKRQPPAVFGAGGEEAETASTRREKRQDATRKTAGDLAPTKPEDRTRGPAQQQNRVVFGTARQDGEREQLESAAAKALVGQPPSLPEILEALGRFRTADFGSLRVVEREACRLPAAVFGDCVERALAREARNDVGLLVTLLRDAREAASEAERQALRVALAAYDEERLDRRRRDPESFLHRLLALPAPAPAPVVADFLDTYVTDDAERARLAAEELRTRAATRQPLGAIRHWIRWVSGDLDLGHAHAQVGEWVELYTLDESDAVLLHQELDDARQQPVEPVAAAEQAA